MIYNNLGYGAIIQKNVKKYINTKYIGTDKQLELFTDDIYYNTDFDIIKDFYPTDVYNLCANDSKIQIDKIINYLISIEE